MKPRQKALLSVLLFLISIALFIIMPPLKTQTTARTTATKSGEQQTEKIVTVPSTIRKPLEWISIGALFLAVWIWRKELGITQLGPLGGSESITQQEAGQSVMSEDESGNPPSFDRSKLKEEMEDAETGQRLEHILQMFRKRGSLNAAHVARELNVTSHDAKTDLFILTQTGQLRADGFPKSTVYTPAHSLENRLLDATKHRLASKYGIIAERRYLRIGKKHEIDALFESDNMKFVVEGKILRAPVIRAQLDMWIYQLIEAAEALYTKRVACVLAFACLGKADPSEEKKRLAGFTFDSGDVPVQIFVFSETELPT